MNISRAYLMPWHGMAASRAYSMLSGLGDINSQAAASLTAAGYTGVTCKPVVTTYPGGSYTQNVCTTNQGVSPIADEVVGMSMAQLQAQLAEEAPYVGASDSTILSNILQLTGNAGAAANVGTNANNVQYASWVDSLPPGVPINGATPEQLKLTPAYQAGTQGAGQQLASQIPVAPTQTVATSSSSTSASGASLLSGLNLDGSTIITGVPDVLVYAGGAVAALVLISMMGGHKR